MNRRSMLGGLAASGLAFLSGCVDSETNNDPNTKDEDFPDSVDRFVDEEPEVVCYRWAVKSGHSTGAGMECIPLSETEMKFKPKFFTFAEYSSQTQSRIVAAVAYVITALSLAISIWFVSGITLE